MDRYTVIFVTDKRQAAIGGFLSASVESCRFQDEECESRCMEMLRRAECVVLPIPIGKVTKYEDMSQILKANLTNCKMLCGGLFDAEWQKWCGEHDMICYDFMQDETVARENARITAEGTVAEILKTSRYSVRGQKMVVTGYGRCGKETADLLRRMGAKVTVMARSRDARQQAKNDGHDAVDFSYGPEEMYGAYSIINTVPACVLTRTMIAEMHKEAVIYDIASLPGGTDEEAAEEYGIPVVRALGLPGKYTTKSSAKILADAIQRQMLPQRDMREGRSWIFQIII